MNETDVPTIARVTGTITVVLALLSAVVIAPAPIMDQLGSVGLVLIAGALLQVLLGYRMAKGSGVCALALGLLYFKSAAALMGANIADYA